MTKATTNSRLATAGAQPKSVPTTAETKAKRQRSKAAHADRGSATATAAVAPIECPTETTFTQAIPAATSKPPRQTKAALLRARLTEPGGVSLAALIEATGWQAHTLRAAMSGLRKEGLTLTRRREGENTIYAIDPVGTAAAKTAGEGADEDDLSKTPRDAMPEGVDAGAAYPAPASFAAGADA
jgi:hypothetical protein